MTYTRVVFRPCQTCKMESFAKPWISVTFKMFFFERKAVLLRKVNHCKRSPEIMALPFKICGCVCSSETAISLTQKYQSKILHIYTMDDSTSSSKIHTVHIKDWMAAWMAAITFVKLRNLVVTEKRMGATVPRIKHKNF